MTNPQMALVPVSPTEEMVAYLGTKLEFATREEHYISMLAMAPNGGEVSLEQVEKLKDILKTVMVGRLADDVVVEFLGLLNLRVDGQTRSSILTPSKFDYAVCILG